jgi:preprotein translocase subunit SecA
MTVLFLQEKEFLKMFKMPVIEVPTNLPNIRVDLPIQAFAVRLRRSEIIPNFFPSYDERKFNGK